MKQTVLMPVYMKEFSCSGSLCEYTCCNGWRVNIDEATLKKYRHCKDAQWREKFNKNITAATQEGQPAKCRMEENGDCSFMDEGLCSIQKTFGAGYLSYTCRMFPRGYNNVRGNFEKWASLGCPEIIKALLLSDKRISLVEETAEKVVEQGAKITLLLDDKHYYAKKFYQLRHFSFSVLQNSLFTVAERLLILAYFFDNFKDDKKNVDVDRLIAMFEQIIGSGEIKEVIKEVRPERKIHFSLLKKILVTANGAIKNDVYTLYYNKMAKELCLGASDDRFYFELYDRYYKVFLQKYPLIMENYLVNAAFIELFPLQRPNVWDSFMLLLIRYMLMNFFLMGLAVEGKTQIDQKKLLECFCSISRILDSVTPPFSGQVLEGMKAGNESDILHAFYMIKV